MSSDVTAFHAALRSSTRLLALCGAGLSASSGLPTFRGAGGLWRNYEATSLATMRAFTTDPGLVWLFYAYRRHLALRAEPNAGHLALAELARTKQDEFVCLTQNVDNLSQRANHPLDQLLLLHGSLFDIKCSNASCSFTQKDNMDDPFCEALAPAAQDFPPGEPNPLLDPYHRIKHVSEEELPKCPLCKTGLQRPAVVWFGEDLDFRTLSKAEKFLKDGVDIILVVGTSAQVYPAAGFIAKARRRGARVVVVDPKAREHNETYGLQEGDFAFAGDAATLLPELLAPLIGNMKGDGTFER